MNYWYPDHQLYLLHDLDIMCMWCVCVYIILLAESKSGFHYLEPLCVYSRMEDGMPFDSDKEN